MLEGLQEDIENDIGGGFKFGRIEKIAFARVIDATTSQVIGQEESAKIWEALVNKGYLDEHGDITDKFVPEKDEFRLELPKEIESLSASIIDEMKRFIFKNRIVNIRDRRTLQYNKRIELNENFKIIWQKINKKTRYSVEFKTSELLHMLLKK